MFLGNTLYFHRASFHPSGQLGADEFNAGSIMRWTSIPYGGGGEKVEKTPSRLVLWNSEISTGLMGDHVPAHTLSLRLQRCFFNS